MHSVTAAQSERAGNKQTNSVPSRDLLKFIYIPLEKYYHFAEKLNIVVSDENAKPKKCSKPRKKKQVEPGQPVSEAKLKPKVR